MSQEIDLMLKNLMILASTKKSSRNSYYEKVFTKIINGKKLNWNWSACLFSTQWMSYRKMYGLGLLIYFSFLITLVCSILVFVPLFPLWLFLILVFCVAISFMFLIGAFGNYLYFLHLKKKIEKNYHLAKTIKAVDRISMLIWFLSPILAFVSGAIISIKDRIKVSKISSERGVK